MPLIRKNLLEMNNSYVRSFVIIDEQLQSGLLPQSVILELLADRQPSSEHRGRYNLPSMNQEVAILIPGKSRAARSIVVQPRAVDCHGACLQVVSETHSSLGPSTTCCAAVSVRHRRLSPGHPEGRQGKVGHRYGILLLATDAARWLNVVLRGGRLFQQYVVMPPRNWNSSG